MLNIVCVKTGAKYGPEYVNVLFDMVRRNLPEGTPGHFICFTEDQEGLTEGIEHRFLPEPYRKGWWAKLYLFAPGVFAVDDRVIYFDLDSVITGPLDKLLLYDGDFATLRDPFDTGVINSGIMLWRAGTQDHIFESWRKADYPEVPGGDQAWILTQIIRPDLLQDLYPTKFFSFKKDCFSGLPPRESMVVYFHGEPKPHNCGVDWVNNIWKIGGGSAAEIELVCNTADDVLRAHIRNACRRCIPWLNQHEPHDGHAVIVGGGPSVKGYVEEIRELQALGYEIFATNNVFGWLQRYGIEPDAHVIVDARYENHAFVPLHSNATHYYASQCHPEVLKKSQHHDMVLWHSYTSVLEESLYNPEKKPECFVACGSTVGLSAMGIAYALGFRTLHLYGFDSSYVEDEHHAYEQALNSDEIVMDILCAGRMFKCSSWMVAQADQFQVLVGELMKDGCEITVRGTGLIPWIALNFQADETPDNDVREIDGTWWPSRDERSRHAIEYATQFLPDLLAHVPGRKCVIQAGGNVGLFPKAFGKHFDRVITFEPDALNFRCLELNLNGDPVERYQSALADTEEQRGIARNPRNCGAHCLVDGDEVSTMTIDGLALTACDLIQLDVEGYEMKALKGAEWTIRQYKPVICVEQNGLGNRYGATDEDVTAFIEALGYERKAAILRDVVYVPVANR